MGRRNFTAIEGAVRAWLRAVPLCLLLVACSHTSSEGTIGQLDQEKIEIKDAEIDGGLDKAMQGYQQFLDATPESELTPEAIRRLADLKVEKEFGTVTDGKAPAEEPSAKPSPPPAAPPPAPVPAPAAVPTGKDKGKKPAKAAGKNGKKTATGDDKAKEETIGDLQLPPGESAGDLRNTGAEEAIRLYRKLLDKYPNYERNDQVLYQLSRAYEETGQVDEAMQIMNRLVKQYPNSRYTDEVQFRRGEYFFTRKKYLDAEEAYGEILKFGLSSVYYERGLYKMGWTYYKQEMYEEALVKFFALLDYKVSIGYDFDQTTDDIERKRTDDTFQAVSLSFSNLGGATSVGEYFVKHGSRSYEDKIYSELAEFYFAKRRYSDAAATYNTFIGANKYHKKSPFFSMRVIEIYLKGGFPRLVIEGKKNFASSYGLRADYWNYFNQADFPEVLVFLKTNLIDLANHYHAMYQNPKFKADKTANYDEAVHWYREFLQSFPKDKLSPGINYQLADLYLENKDFKAAAVEYERSAYDYPVNEKSMTAAYAAVYAYREYLKDAPSSQVRSAKQEVIRVSIRLVDVFPKHEKATIVLGAAVDDLFNMRDFPLAIKLGRRLIVDYPKADAKIRRGAWLVVAHSSYEIENFEDAEEGYVEVLKLTSKEDSSREKLVENLAASVYKQGEKARAAEDYKTAVRHFLRIAELAPTAKIRINAEYDAAAVLIQIMDLEKAVDVLLAFRANYPGHELQFDVTKKIAFAYKEMGKFNLAGKEYERVAAEAEGKDNDLVREAMWTAAELYEKAPDTDNALRVYKKFVVKFPKPLEFALDTYYKIAMIYKTRNSLQEYRDTLLYIINSDAKAGAERTDRTRYLAAQSSLVIIEPQFDEFLALKIVKPFKKSLTRKQQSMKDLVTSYTKLVDYKVADVTAASTYYVAEIYYNFSHALLESEKPEGMSDDEIEEFNLMVEEQAYPFEEKSIKVHEKNIELLKLGIYSVWVDRSIEKLSKLLPARYAKPEESTSYITKFDMYMYSSPRFVRDELSAGFIADLQLYRYVVKNAETVAPKGDEKDTKTDTRNPVVDDKNAKENTPMNLDGLSPTPLDGGNTSPPGDSTTQPAGEMGAASAPPVATEQPQQPVVDGAEQAAGAGSAGAIDRETAGSPPVENGGGAGQ